MAVGSSDDRVLWDLDARPLDGYTNGGQEAEVVSDRPTLQDERTTPKKAPSPVTRPNPRNPNRAPVVAPATAYTPGVLNCVRGAPPRRVTPKKSR